VAKYRRYTNFWDVVTTEREVYRLGKFAMEPGPRNITLGHVWAFTWRVLWAVPWMALMLASAATLVGIPLAILFGWIGLKPLLNHERRQVAARLQRMKNENQKATMN
jgi:hypothetical protein